MVNHSWCWNLLEIRQVTIYKVKEEKYDWWWWLPVLCICYLNQICKKGDQFFPLQSDIVKFTSTTILLICTYMNILFSIWKYFGSAKIKPRQEKHVSLIFNLKIFWFSKNKMPPSWNPFEVFPLIWAKQDLYSFNRKHWIHYYKDEQLQYLNLYFLWPGQRKKNLCLDNYSILVDKKKFCSWRSYVILVYW